jgi:hypothetical protein
MDKLLLKIESFEKKVKLIVFKVFKFFGSKDVKVIDCKIQNLQKEYQILIEQYNLIQSKESKLSKAKRDAVLLRVAHLVSKGHIKVD